MNTSKGQLQSSIIIDELPTIYFRGLDFISTARSNRISSLSGIQDYSQLTRDYGDKESKVIQNTVSNNNEYLDFNSIWSTLGKDLEEEVITHRGGRSGGLERVI